MLLGRTVVYPNTAGPADFMIDGQTGLAYPIGDDQALARCISALIADPVRRIGLGQRARQHAEQLFSPASYGGKAYLILKRLRDQGRTDRSTGSSFLAVLESAEAAELEAMRSVLAEQCSARDVALRRQVSQRLGQLQSGLLSFLNAGCTARSSADPSGLGARLALVFWKVWLRLGLPANTWRRRWPDLQAILLSGLFDEGFYRAVHPDLEAGVEPILHYLDQGGFQGRDPNPFFDSDWYLEKNPDVAAAGVNPLLHYIRHGAAERRSCHPGFDPSWYLENNPDAIALATSPVLAWSQS